MKLTIQKLASPVRSGDWHDKPMRWEVLGAERQMFATKKNATLWAKLRKASGSFNDTFMKYMQAHGLYA